MAESSETSPLLADIDRPEENEREPVLAPSTGGSPWSATSYFRLPIKILTILLLISSILALAVFVASDITIHYAPFQQFYWHATDAIKPTASWVFVSLIFSIINLIYMLPVFVNIPLDIILPTFIMNWASTLIQGGWPNGDWCGPDRGFGPDPVPTDCDKWVVATKVLIGVSAGIAVLVGVIHLIILLLRIIAAVRTRFWKRISVSGFSFPTGRVRIGFTVEVLRQEEGISDARNQSGSSTA